MPIDYNSRKSGIENEINKLKEQIKLLEELDKLQKNHVNSLQSADAIQKSINARYEVTEKLLKAGIDTSKNSFDIEVKKADILKEQARLTSRLNEVNKQIETQTKQQAELEAELAEKEADRIKRKEEARKNQLKSEIDSYKNQTKVDQLKQKELDLEMKILEKSKRKTAEARKRQLDNNKRLKELREEIALEEKRQNRENKSKESIKASGNSIKIPGLGTVGQLREFSELSMGAKLISVAADTFNTAVDKFGQLFLQGMNRISNNANSQFQNISVRTGMNYGTYRSGVAGLGGLGGGTLSNWRGLNLSDNIKAGDVQDMMNTLANTGMGQEQLLANAIDTVLTKNIVPYLELSTAELQQFNINTNGELMKQVRGIAKTNQDMFDGNEVANQYLQEELEYLAPMSAVAELDLIQNDEEMMAYYQQLRSQGMSDDQIAREISSVRKIRTNPADVLQNGSLAEQLAVINGELNGRNFVEDQFGIARDVGGSKQLLANMGPKSGGLVASVYSNVIGSSLAEQYELSRAGYNRGAAEAGGYRAGAALAENGNAVTQAFANGDNQTKQQKQEATLENLSTDLAMWKTDMGVWFDVLTTVVKGIASILITWAAGKAVSGIAGKLGGKAIGSGIGKSIAGGLQNLGGGLATGTTGSVGAGLAVTAGAVAGAAMGVDGGIKAFENFKKGDAAGGALRTTEAVAGIGGAAALVALGASNPIGWIALGVGAIAMFAAKSHEYNESLKDNVENNRAMAKDIKAKWDENNKAIQNEITQREDSLYEIKSQLENGKDLDTVRNELIESGILTEEDINKARVSQRDELINLTNAYIEATKKLSGASEEVNDIFSNYEQDLVGGMRNEIARYVEDHKGNEKGNAHYDEMYKILTTAVNQTYEKQRNGQDLSDAEKELIKGWEWASEDDDVSRSDINAIFSGWTKVTGKQLGEMLSTESLAELAKSGYDYGSHTQGYLSGRLDEEASKAIISAAAATHREDAISLLQSSGYTPESPEPYGSAIKKAMEAQKINWESAKGYYRTGTDSIPYDNYPAMLHEGEAVLTASTANELRGLVDEYRATKEDNIRIEQAINDQTTVLVERLNAIYNRISEGLDPMKSVNIMPGKLDQNVQKMTLPFN